MDDGIGHSGRSEDPAFKGQNDEPPGSGDECSSESASSCSSGLISGPRDAVSQINGVPAYITAVSVTTPADDTAALHQKAMR